MNTLKTQVLKVEHLYKLIGRLLNSSNKLIEPENFVVYDFSNSVHTIHGYLKHFQRNADSVSIEWYLQKLMCELHVYFDLYTFKLLKILSKTKAYLNTKFDTLVKLKNKRNREIEIPLFSLIHFINHDFWTDKYETNILVMKISYLNGTR